MSTEGFKAVKKKVLKALTEGNFQHHVRSFIEEKNLLSTGEVTVSLLIDIIKKADGTCYECSPHHQISTIDCHLIKCKLWYVKFYFLDADTFFISVHQ